MMVNRTLLADSRASWLVAHQFNDPASVKRRDDACHEFIAIAIVRLSIDELVANYSMLRVD